MELEDAEDIVDYIESVMWSIYNARTEVNGLRAKSEEIRYLAGKLDKDFVRYYKILEPEFFKTNDLIEEQDEKLEEIYLELQNVLQSFKQRVAEVQKKNIQQKEQLKKIPGYTKLQNLLPKVSDVVSDKVIDIMYYKPGQPNNNSNSKNAKHKIQEGVKLFGKKIADIKQSLENKINRYAKENKLEILKKAKAILKEDKNKKIRAVIVALVVSGAVGAKVYNQIHSKFSRTSDISEIEQISDEVDVVSEPIDNDNAEGKEYMPYSVDVPGLRLRAKPSTQERRCVSNYTKWRHSICV